MFRHYYWKIKNDWNRRQRIRKKIQLIEENRRTPKNTYSIMFVPHGNSEDDHYDILNPNSDNVLCLLVSILNDVRFCNYELYIGYYDEELLNDYMHYCLSFNLKMIHFFQLNNEVEFRNAFNKSHVIFTDEIYRSYPTKIKSQKIICLNYFANLLKGDFHRISLNGGFPMQLKEQQRIYDTYDYFISISDICSKLIAIDNCVYNDSCISLGFPRDDIFFQDNSKLRDELIKLVNLKVDYIYSYVPTHRDYENPNREFYDSLYSECHSIFGAISEIQFQKIEETLEKNNSIIIAKVHPAQFRDVLKIRSTSRIIFYDDIVNRIRTSLNPLLAISDFLITDYTSAVYDYMFLDRPIIYYMYDYEKFINGRGLFMNPVEPICMGEIVYDIEHLCSSIDAVAHGADPYKDKRKILSDLFIKYKDGNSAERIKKHFFPEAYE